MAIKSRFVAASLALFVLSNAVLGDWRYRSRPDLSPPRLNITIPAESNVAPGYIFIAPFPSVEAGRTAPEQPTAYIFRNDGDLVWSGLGYLGGWVGNFQAVRYNGRPVLQAFQGALDLLHGHGFGTVALLDETYQQIATVQSRHKLLDLHEFRIIDEKTALVEIYQPTLYDLSPYGGRGDDQWIVDGIWQEIDIETGNLLCEGHTLNFASPSESVTLHNESNLSGSSSFNAWDYLHINSVDKNSQGDYLLSGRHTSTLYKLSGADGSLLWRLGGANSTFFLSEEDEFAYQHNARFLSRSDDGTIETISLFDNSARGNVRIREFSSALIIQLNHTDRTATSLARFIAPDRTLAPSQGNTQILPNGNVFVNWGQSGAVTEFSADGTPIFHAYLSYGDVGAQSYRGFRNEWVGRPRETPLVAALRRYGETTVYVSWNGDTETARWEFYARDGNVQERLDEGRRRHRLGAAKRVSFETSLVVADKVLLKLGKGVEIFAVALDTEGMVIGKSEGVAIQDDLRHGVAINERFRSKEQTVLSDL